MSFLTKCLLVLVIAFLYSSAHCSYLFYNNAAFGTADSGISPLIAGSSVSGDNFSNNDEGIKGVYFDVAGVNYGDLVFRQGNTNDPSTWADARPDIVDGSAGSYFLSWDTGIKNAWLQIAYGANQIYIGNLVGDSNKDGTVSPADALLIINYLNSGAPVQVDILNNYDITKDGAVTPSDVLAVINVLNHQVSSLNTSFSWEEGTPTLYYNNAQQLRLPFNYGSPIPIGMKTRALSILPVPEPSAMLLLGIGLLGLVRVSRRTPNKA